MRPNSSFVIRRLSSVICRLYSVFCLLLLATFLRFYRLDYQSYWNDEGNSRVLASRDAPTIIRNAAADVHPPGYYLLLAGWRSVLGQSEFALRGLSAFFGILLVAVVYRLGREWFGGWAGVGAALLVAVNPFLIYYSQEARMYSQLALMGTLSFLFFWKANSRNLFLIIGYWLFTTLGLYTQYAFGFVIIAQLLVAFIQLGASPHKRGLLLTAYCLLFTIPFLLFLPWLPTALRHLSWPAERAFPADALAELVRYLAYGRTVESGAVTLGLVAVGAIVLFTLLQNGFTPAVRATLVWLVVPAGLTLWQGLLSDTFAKVLVVAVPPLCVLMGLALGGQPVTVNRGWSIVFRLSSSIVLAYCTYLSLNNLYFNPAYFRDDYRGIAQTIDRLGEADDAVITIAPNQAEAFAYYFRDEARLFPLPDARPLDPVRTQAQLENLAATHPRIFVLYWGDQQADPEKFVERWLNANTFKAGEQWFGQVRLATYAAARPATSPTTLTSARFGEHITLEGYKLSSMTAAPGDILQLTLFWRTEATLTERYKVFVHLYEEVNVPPVAQTDSEPGGALWPTTLWSVGQPVADNHGLHLPPDLLPGQYRLMLGLYNLNDGTRLPVQVGGTISGDRLEIGTITITTNGE